VSSDSVLETDVVVVGAGVCGLTAAYMLQQRGFRATVLEAEDHVGGKTAAVRRDGFTLNTGATLLAGGYAAVAELAGQLKIDDTLGPYDSPIGIVRDGDVHPMRIGPLSGVVDLVRAPVLSPRSKLQLLRLALDAFRVRHKVGYERIDLLAEVDVESVEAYCDRRLNREILMRLIDPLLGGLWIADPEQMTVADLHHTVAKVLPAGLWTYRGGIDFLARELATRLDVRLSAPVSLIERTEAGARVVWTENGAPSEATAAGVITTVGARQLSGVYPGLDAGIQAILNEGFQLANYGAVRFALDRDFSAGVPIIVVPHRELGGLSTIIHENVISNGVVPVGGGLVCALLYHEWCEDNAALSDDEVVERVLPHVERVLPGITGAIRFTQVNRWRPATLRSVPGMYRLIDQVQSRLDSTHRVQVAGDFLGVPGINGSVLTGQSAARRLAKALSGDREK